MPERLQSKIALIAGAGGREIGVATARLFAGEGASVGLASRNGSELRAVAGR